MASSVATAAAGLLGLAGTGLVAACCAVVARRERPYLPGSIAAGLDVGREPLAVALHHGYAGLHLRVRLDDDRALRLAGADGTPGPTLERAVLAPLAARVKPTTHGRVYAPQGEPFLLLLESAGELESAGDADAAYEVLAPQLREHASMLSRCIGGRVTRAAVLVVLTGPGWPAGTLAAEYERYAFLEGMLDTGEPASLVPLIAERIAERIGWDPRERWTELPAEARHLLRSLVAAAHQDGRQIRFVDLPEWPRRDRLTFWREVFAAGADYIGSTNTTGLARFLRKTGAHRRPTHARVEPSRRAAQGFAR
jgi:hypothetical protein